MNHNALKETAHNQDSYCRKTTQDPILGQTSLSFGPLAALLSGPHFPHLFDPYLTR